MNTFVKPIRPTPKRGYKRDDAAHYIGVSPTTFDTYVAQGKMPQPKRVGGNVIWDVHQLDIYFDNLGEAKENLIDQAMG